LRQHFLKAAARSAGTRIIATKFFDEVFLAVYEAEAALYLGLGGIAFAALTAALESREVLRSGRYAYVIS